jgi:hypothetical protein
MDWHDLPSFVLGRFRHRTIVTTRTAETFVVYLTMAFWQSDSVGRCGDTVHADFRRHAAGSMQRHQQLIDPLDFCSLCLQLWVAAVGHAYG